MPTVYKTGHEIADKVSDSFKPLGYEIRNIGGTTRYSDSDCHIAYGILRGTSDIFWNAKNKRQKFIFLDKGFFKPNHFNGYYRFGINQFQQGYHPHTFGDERLRGIMKDEPLEIEQYRGENIVVIPPSEHVAAFYGLGSTRIWLQNMLADLAEHTERPIVVRYKTSGTPLEEHLRDAYCVVSHTSSVAWEALRHGIPAIGDPKGIIHGWNGLTIRDIDTQRMEVGDVRSLYSYMAYYQFTLKEISDGRAKHLIEGIQ